MSKSKSVDLTANTIESHEVRHLIWKYRQVCKQLGKAATTIYQLRNENAALREATTWNPGDRARLYAEVRALSVENRRLQEKLNHSSTPTNEGDPS